MPESNLYFTPKLLPEHVDLDTDLAAVAHPKGGMSDSRSMSLRDLALALGVLPANGSTISPTTAIFFYTFNNQTTASDPGGGKYRYNNSNQLAATEMYFDWTTLDGFDPTQIFLASEVNTTFIIQDKDFALNWQKWRLTAKATNMADWFKVDVELVATSPNPLPMKNQKAVAVIVQFALPLSPDLDAAIDDGMKQTPNPPAT